MNTRWGWIAVWSIISLSLMGLILASMLIETGSAFGGNTLNTSTVFVEPADCWEPPHDYTRVWVYGMEFNTRTLAMLDHAQALYGAQGGIVDFRRALTQGSYTGGALAASFGTHDGGGALDLSVLSLQDGSVLVDEIEPMIHALRLAGFAAWLRDTGELYPGSAIHIHAVAVGDYELSPMAQEQISGTFGYLRGSNGLPTLHGFLTPDRYGGPIICGWMIAQGFNDMRGWPNPYPTPGGTTVPRPPIP
jgi:hypothetical protein